MWFEKYEWQLAFQEVNGNIKHCFMHNENTDLEVKEQNNTCENNSNKWAQQNMK